MTQQVKPGPVPATPLSSVGGARRVSREAGEPRLSWGCSGISVGAAVVVMSVEGDIVVVEVRW